MAIVTPKEVVLVKCILAMTSMLWCWLNGCLIILNASLGIFKWSCMRLDWEADEERRKAEATLRRHCTVVEFDHFWVLLFIALGLFVMGWFVASTVGFWGSLGLLGLGLPRKVLVLFSVLLCFASFGVFETSRFVFCPRGWLVLFWGVVFVEGLRDLGWLLLLSCSDVWCVFDTGVALPRLF